nr:OmpA family protein [Bacteroidota bacterium]
DSFKAIGDTLSEQFKIDTLHHSYTTNLSTQIYLGGTYKFTDKINAGVLFYGQIFDKAVHPGVALSYNQTVRRWLSFSVSYSIYNRSYNNLGLGFSLNAGPVQLYVVSDNLLGAIFPQNAKNLHVHTGINLTFGRKALDKDKDGIADKTDECPDVAGTLELKGCPDKDKDGIADKNDICPEIPGLPQFNGCPDTDGDAIVDSQDACPDIPGLVEFNGCPDKDGDKIIDKEDECPDEPGLLEFKGCPDRDGDGVIDKIDLCPDKPGPVSNNGCPEKKLLLIDAQGKTLRTVTAKKDGSFSFDELPADEFVIFKIEGEDTDNIEELKIVVCGITKRALRDKQDKYFRFIVLTTDVNKLGKENEQDVAIKLSKQEAEILKKAFSNLEFAAAKDIIKPESFSSLDELAGLMAKKSNWKLKISGHTDNQGKPVTNLTLSKKRAEAVKKYLVSKGIAADRFKVEWFGASKPIADNKTEAGRQKNRRVEMLIIE